MRPVTPPSIHAPCWSPASRNNGQPSCAVPDSQPPGGYQAPRGRLFHALAAILLAGALAGCAGPTDKTAKKKSDEKGVEYVEYTPTGSRIPVRVRKDQIQASESETTQDQNLIRDLQQRGSKPVTDGESAASRR